SLHTHTVHTTPWRERIVIVRWRLSSHRSCFVAHNNADASSGRFRHSCHFHDGGGPVPISPHQKLARMEGTQCCAMAHAEYRRSREPLAHESIEPRLGSFGRRRSGLV